MRETDETYIIGFKHTRLPLFKTICSRAGWKDD